MTVLEKARALVRKGWTQGAYVRGKSGRSLEVMSRSATCFCARGAVFRVCGGLDAYPANDALALLDEAVGGKRYMGTSLSFNDKKGRKKAEVIAAFGRAIAIAKLEVTS